MLNKHGSFVRFYMLPNTFRKILKNFDQKVWKLQIEFSLQFPDLRFTFRFSISTDWGFLHLSRRSFWPDFRIVRLPKMPASGWGSLWESSSFVPWLVLNAFRDITGVVPDLPWISGFMRKSSFTWVKWVGNVSLYRNYPQNIRSIRMYSVLYPESNFWWVFRNGSGMVLETFHNTFLGGSSKFFLIYCCQLSFVSGCHFLGKILISC